MIPERTAYCAFVLHTRECLSFVAGGCRMDGWVSVRRWVNGWMNEKIISETTALA